MGTLYIDKKGIHIKLDGNTLSFYLNGIKEGSAPINPLKKVIVVGNITLESSVLNKLTENNISVIFLSGKRLRFCGMLHGRLHNNGILRIRQYEKFNTSSFTTELSKELIEKKLIAQVRFLEDAINMRADKRFPLTTSKKIIEGILKKLPQTDLTKETIRGLEGSASSAYFQAYTTLFSKSLRFTKRTKRPPQDPVNAMLSLCYTLLHFELVREIELIGLDPTIGFYHQFEYGRESLACDLTELYRTEVDCLVWTMFKERIFTGRDFANDDERPGCYLKKESRKRFYPLYEEWAKNIRLKLTQEVRALAEKIKNEEDIIY
jgi:CRISPR-associated protein Cas1